MFNKKTVNTLDIFCGIFDSNTGSFLTLANTEECNIYLMCDLRRIIAQCL